MKRRTLILDLTLVVALAFGVTYLNVQWAILNQAPPSSDDNSHLYNALQVLANVSRAQQPVSLLMLYPGHYPPLAYQVTLLFYGVFGVAPWVPIASFFPFLALLGLSMYGIGAGLGGRAVGLVCAVTTLCAPVVLDHSRTYFLDMPSTAALAASVCTLLYSRSFTRRGWSILFGLSMVAGMLSKWTHPVFVLPFLAVAMYGALRDMYAQRWPGLVGGLLVATASLTAVVYVLYAPAHNDQQTFDIGPAFRWRGWFGAAALVLLGLAALRRAARSRLHLRPFTHMLEAFALSVLLAWPWYYYNGSRVREKIVYQAHVEVDPLLGLWLYLQDVSVMIYLAPVLLLIGLCVGLARPRLRAWTLLLALSVAVSTAFAVLLPPDSRYIMPVIVFIVPLALLWTSHVERAEWSSDARTLARAVQWAVLAGVTGVALWQATAFEWRRRGFEGLDGPRRAQASGPWGYLGFLPALPAPPVPGTYPYADVLRAIRKGDAAAYLWVGVLESSDDAATFQPRSFLYHAALIDEKLFVVETADALERAAEVHDVDQVKTFLLIYRFPQTRETLLRDATARGWLKKGARAEQTFVFSPDFHVELFRVPGPPAGT